MTPERRHVVGGEQSGPYLLQFLHEGVLKIWRKGSVSLLTTDKGVFITAPTTLSMLNITEGPNNFCRKTQKFTHLPYI